MRVVTLFSGGKDSNYALLWALRQGWDVPYVVTVYSQNPESYMFQTAGIELSEYAAKAVGIHQVKVWTEGEKEREVLDLADVIARLTDDEDLDGVVAGALKSEYQKSRIDGICNELGIKSLSPIWHKDPEEHLRTVIEKEGFDILILSVSAEGLDESWLGRKLDLDCIQDLLAVKEKHGINIDGEGGEFETMVLDATHYRQRIVIDEAEPVWKRDSGHLVVKKAHLESK
jgi:ABC transporter with metal-binding/Fe-S-binding domain ATP-binding protein